MSNHPITPPPELVEEWFNNSPIDRGLTLATQAAQWGADQQLEDCCEQVKSIPSPFGVPLGEMASNALRNACRPDPPTLKEQALKGFDDISQFALGELEGTSYYEEYKKIADTVLKALEAL